MANITIALIFVVTLNIFMWLSQVAILDLNPIGTKYYHCEGSILETLDKNKCIGDKVLNDESINNLPSGEGIVSPTTGNFFVDVFTSIKDWFVEKTRLNYLIAIVKAPYNILTSINLPDEITFALGSLWYGITIFLVVSFFWGREA